MTRTFISLLLAVMLTAPFGLSVRAVRADTDQPDKPPLLTSVFEKQRSEVEDVIYFRNNDILRGTVLNKTLGINTPYGNVSVDLRKCAGVSFEGSRANTEALVTVNRNRLTGIITDRVIRFKIGSSGETIDIRKEKVRFILLRRLADELDFIDPNAKRDLFVMTNGDLLTGKPREKRIAITTDYGTVNTAFDEMRQIEMQGGDNVTAVITKQNKDVMRGTLETEEITLDLDLGVSVDAIYKDKFAKVFIEHVPDEMIQQFGLFQPVEGESDGAGTTTLNPSVQSPMTNSIGMKLVYVAPGEFTMGSPSDELNREGDEKQHLVRLTKGIYMATTEVTQAQWRAIMGDSPSRWGGDRMPVSDVSWNDAISFCQQLSNKEGKKYRLPTEAEWEYACRAGSTGPLPKGTVINDVAWYDRNSSGKYHNVGGKRPNAWGLYDMHGNVWEWCSDWYGDYPSGTVTDPKGANSGQSRVLRGGSWYYAPQSCRSAYRDWNTPDYRLHNFGFRVVLDLN